MHSDAILERTPAPIRAAPAPGGRRHRRARSRVRVPLAVTAACQAVWLLWWLAARPARLGPDTASYLGALTGPGWTATGGPVGYDALVHWSLTLTGSAAPLTLLQTSAMSLALGYTVAALARLGARGRWTAPTAVALAVLPPTGGFVVLLGADVPFTVSAVLATAAALRLAAHRRAAGALRLAGRAVRLDLAVLAFALPGLALFGAHGLGVVLAVAAVLLVLLPTARRRVTALTVVALAVPLLLDLAGDRVVPVDQRPAAVAVHTLRAADLAVAYHRDPALFGPADTALLASLAPLPAWSAAGDHCATAAALTAGSGWNRRLAATRGAELSGLWLRVLRQRPDDVFAARLCRAQPAWSPAPGPAAQGGSTATPELDALRSSPDLLTAAAGWLHTLCRTPQLEWLLWRGATWTYLALAALLVYARRHRYTAVLPAAAAVLVGIQLTLTFTATGPDYRTMATALFLGPMLLTLLTAPTARGR